MGQITENIEKVRAELAEEAGRCGRDPDDILLLAVTKLHSPEEINEAIDAGITDIGENKVQELVSKYDAVRPGVRWHLIGHLQTNKVRYIIDKVCMVHSVDSLHLAREIDKRAGAAGRTMDILVQVNAAGEESKSGVSPAEAEALLESIAEECPNLRVRGLMHIAPYADDPEDVRVYFREVKRLFDEIKKSGRFGSCFDTLSMGMTHDHGVAVEEGSTLVRIGTAIFGQRNYSKGN